MCGLLGAVASLAAEHRLYLGAQVSVAAVRGLSGCGSQALEHWLRAWCTGFLAPRHVGSSGTRDGTSGFLTAGPPRKLHHWFFIPCFTLDSAPHFYYDIE